VHQRPVAEVARVVVSEPVPVLAAEAVALGELAWGSPVDLEAPALTLSVVPTPAEDPEAVEVALLPPPPPVVLADATAMAANEAPNQRGNGFFSGALRKTRDGIVKTGIITGSSIADAFKGMLGAFKKVSPF